MCSDFDFVYALVLEDEEGYQFLAISPCGGADPKDLVLLEDGAFCTVKECVYVNRLSNEFQLLAKMMDISEISAVYALAWEKQGADNGTLSGDS